MPITRMFSNTADARAALDELKQAGFPDRCLYIVTGPTDAASGAAIEKRGISPARARDFLARIQAGETLVVVEAPLGTAGAATEVLERARPGDSGPGQAVYEGMTRDNATPLSSAFNIPVLSRDPTPFSRFWRMPTLLHRDRPKTTSLGFKLLTDDPAPLSSALGWPVLARDPAPLSSKLGLRVLSDQAAPLSSRLGWKLLLNDPAPLSSWLGLSVLSGDQASRR